MAENIGNLNLRIGADASGLISNVRSSADEVSRFSQNVRRSSDEVKSAFAGVQQRSSFLFASVTTRGGMADGLNEVKTAATDMLASIAARGGTAGLAIAGITAAVVALASAARSANKEIADLGKLSSRLGASNFATQASLRVFERAGFSREESEFTLNRFADRIGDLRRNPTGEGANVFRRIGLDPDQIARMGVTEAFEATIIALSRVADTSDRASAATTLFSRRWQELIPIIQRGAIAFAEAEEGVARNGFSDRQIASAQRLERQVGSLSRTYGEFFTGIRNWASGALSGVLTRADLAAQSFTNIYYGVSRDVARTIASQDAAANRPSRPPVAAGPTSIGRFAGLFDTISDQERMRRILADQAVRALPDTEVQIRIEDYLVSQQEQLRLNETLRSSAIDLGLVRADATRREVEGVRELVRQYQEFVRIGASAQKLAAVNQFSRLQAGQQNAREIQDAIDDLRRRADDVRNGAIDARLRDFEGRLGVTAQQIDALRAELGQAELTRLRRPTSLTTFGTQINAILAAARASGADADTVQTLVGQAFRDAVRSLGPRPSSYAISGIDPRSMEGARVLADLITRRNVPSDPQERAAQELQLLRQVELEELEELRGIGRALQNLGFGVANIWAPDPG